MRIASREGELPDFATDSITSPEISVSRGITPPLVIVAITSRASTFVPTGVFPATTFSRSTTGSSHPIHAPAGVVPLAATDDADADAGLAAGTC